MYVITLCIAIMKKKHSTAVTYLYISAYRYIHICKYLGSNVTYIDLERVIETYMNAVALRR